MWSRRRFLESVSTLPLVGGLIAARSSPAEAAAFARRAFFREMGGTATDHGVEVPLTLNLSEAEEGGLFDRGMQARATPEDQHRFAPWCAR